MKKLVLLAAMLCLVSQGWAFPVHRSRLGDACAPEQQAPETDANENNTTMTGRVVRADDPVLNQVVQEEMLQLQVMAAEMELRQQANEPAPIHMPIILELGNEFFGFSD